MMVYLFFAGVGERTREGYELYHEMKDSGVIDKTALVFGQMNEPPGARMRVALRVLRWRRLLETKANKMSYYSLIIFLDLFNRK